MSLDLPQLLPQVDDLGAFSARRAEEAQAALPEALALLDEAARMDRESLAHKIRAAGDAWRGARPTDEPLDAIFALPALPARLHVLAADGSQVHLDRHASAYFYLVNVGSLHVVHGSGQAPRAQSRPRLAFADEEIYNDSGATIDIALVNARRDVAEMEELARLASACDGEDSLALLDNGLLLWLATQERHRAEVEPLLKAYWAAMDRLHKAGAALAGFIHQPRSVNLLALIHLAGLTEKQAKSAPPRAAAFRGLTDRNVMARRLKPGERSARIVPVSRLNNEFDARSHAVQAFYLHTGEEIARVEVPAWIGESPSRLAQVHAGIVEQCRVTGIPYGLVRAHELAVVTPSDRQALDRLVAAAMARHGLVTHISQKARTKRWTSGRRRHILGRHAG